MIVGLGSPTAGWALSRCKPDADERGPTEAAVCSIEYKLAGIPKLVRLFTGRSVSSSFVARQNCIEFDSSNYCVCRIESHSGPEPGVYCFPCQPVSALHLLYSPKSCLEADRKKVLVRLQDR